MISIERSSATPAYVQLYEGLREDIVRGIYEPDAKLPSVRYVAEELGVSRNTVDKAYQQLYAEGYVVSRNRSGYYVDPAMPTEGCGADWSGRSEGILAEMLKAPADPPVPYDFFYGSLPTELFPAEALRKAVGEALCSLEGSNDYSDEFGLLSLRESLSGYLGRARSVRCSAGQIAIQSGTRDGIERLMHLFDPERHIVAIEQPGFAGVAQVLANNRFSIAPLDVSSSEAFFGDLERSGAKIVFVTPSHQFPTGRIMSYADRMRLIEWAHAQGAFILEDDYDSEYRYQERPIPSLQSLDRYGCVIYTGTFSKAFSPAMRVSYLVLPPEFVGPYRDRMRSYWCPVSWVTQKALGVMLGNGFYEKHVRRQVKYHRTSQRLLIGALHEAFGDKVAIDGEGAGLHLWLHVDDARPTEELIALGLEEGVRVYPSHPYWVDAKKAQPGTLLMGYSAISHRLIAPGIRALARAWR